MKRYIKTLCPAMLAILAIAACSEFDIQRQFDEKYHKIAGITENSFDANETQSFYDIGTGGSVKFHISRGGSDPSLESTIIIASMTNEEISEYTSYYDALPSEYFSMPKSVTFASGEEKKTIEAILSGEQISSLKALIESRNPEERPFALAVRLSSDDGTTINSEKSYFIRPVEVKDIPDFTVTADGKAPAIASQNETVIVMEHGQNEMNIEFSLSAALPIDVTCTIETDHEMLQDFNAAHGQHTIAEAELDRSALGYTAGMTSLSLKMTADDSKFDRTQDVVLPIKAKIDYLAIEKNIYIVFGNKVQFEKEMISFADGISASYSMGTFPDNLIDRDKETWITTGGGNGQWWYNWDNDGYGQSIVVNLGSTGITNLCLRYQTRSSTETLSPGFYDSVTQEGRARPHEIGLGVGTDGNNWHFLGKTIVCDEMTGPDDWTSETYNLDGSYNSVRFGVTRTWEPDPNNTQRLIYFANSGWWCEISELMIYDGKRKFFE